MQAGQKHKQLNITNALLAHQNPQLLQFLNIALLFTKEILSFYEIKSNNVWNEGSLSNSNFKDTYSDSINLQVVWKRNIETQISIIITCFICESELKFPPLQLYYQILPFLIIIKKHKVKCQIKIGLELEYEPLFKTFEEILSF